MHPGPRGREGHEAFSLFLFYRRYLHARWLGRNQGLSGLHGLVSTNSLLLSGFAFIVR